jgi:hypothetical protein
VPHSGDNHCFVARPPALELATRQLRERDLLAIRTQEEGVADTQDFVGQKSSSFDYLGVARFRYDAEVAQMAVGIAGLSGLERPQFRFRFP